MATSERMDAETMFDYLREDIKELGAKMDRVADELSHHAADDHENNIKLIERMTAIEVAQKTKEKISERSANLRSWLVPLITSSIVAYIIAVVSNN